jgi:hypothetical protein
MPLQAGRKSVPAGLQEGRKTRRSEPVRGTSGKLANGLRTENSYVKEQVSYDRAKMTCPGDGDGASFWQNGRIIRQYARRRTDNGRT